jgi:hypothetical protein
MAALNLPAPFGEIDDLAERGDLDGARRALSSVEGNPALRTLLEVKIGLADGTVPPQIAMNRLLVLMRQDANLPGAHELYRQASAKSYDSRESSLAHSHPPPPMKPKDGSSK